MLKYIFFSLGYLSAIHGRSEDVEVIFLPTRGSGNNDEVPFAFTALGHTVKLNLQKNHKLLAPSFQVWRHNESNIIEEVPELSVSKNCNNYLHRDSFTTAAISMCEEGVVNGLILLENAALEITPLREKKSSKFVNRLAIDDETDGFPRQPHVVKRSNLSSIIANDSRFHDATNPYVNFADKFSISDRSFPRTSMDRTATDELTIELAVFFDEAGYKLFSPFYNGDETKIRDMLLAYVNGVQAIFHHPSLGTRIDVALVRLDIMKTQPNDLPHWNGERERLLNSFCSYAERHNPPGDDDSRHWDIGLYVSGLDFYAEEDGSTVTMGLAPVDGACYGSWSCVIAELGVTNRFGKPYPSAGFTSVYIAAHEMGHNLGMRHDSVKNSCTKDGFIMSPSRGTQGETTWSGCSRNVAIKLRERKPCLRDEPSSAKDHRLDHSRYFELPGREWTSKKQCEILLRDRDAAVATSADPCRELRCKTPHRVGYYFAGPALDGTACDPNKECRGGHCHAISPIHNSENSQNKKSGWTEWTEEPCVSGCAERSRGSTIRRRYCRESNNEIVKTICNGRDYEVALCDDKKICVKRWKAIDLASRRCGNFSHYLDVLDPNGVGLQAPHENERLWMGCAVFCKRNDMALYYTPRIELNDLGLDPYFPDGTWCHNENGQDYFCLRRHCLPEHFRFGKDSFVDDDHDNEDPTIGPQNVDPRDRRISDDVVRYLSLGADGIPLSNVLPPRPKIKDDEDAWIDRDYIDVPMEPSPPMKNDISHRNRGDADAETQDFQSCIVIEQ